MTERKVQMCRSAEVQRCRGAEVQRCRGGLLLVLPGVSTPPGLQPVLLVHVLAHVRLGQELDLLHRRRGQPRLQSRF